MPQYGDPDYWNKRYTNQKEATFDWLENWNSLKNVIEKLIDKDARILILGCGNALFSQDMYDAGYENITNIDISDVVIDTMQEMNKDRTNMTWEVLDVMNMDKYSDETFDIAIDKSTIDALLCGSNAFLNVAKMTREVQRVIKTGGIYFVISYGRPENRMIHFQRTHLDFTVEVTSIYPEGLKTEQEKANKTHFIYSCTKGENAIMADDKWPEVEEALTKSDEEKEAKEEDDNVNGREVVKEITEDD